MRWAWRGRPSHPARGFALLIVLWTLVLIAFLVAHLTATGHTEARIADNLVANAVAAAAADGGIDQAIFALSDPQPAGRWELNGHSHEFRIGDSRVAVRAEDEGARINPNLAPQPLLEALLVAVGEPPQSARRLAAAIKEWTGANRSRSKQQLTGDYRAAGLDYRPPQAPLQSLNELKYVLGMTPGLFVRLRPHLTLYGPAIPDASATDPVVGEALAQFAPPTRRRASGRGRQIGTARLLATAHGPGNAEVRRTAIVRIGPLLPDGYVVLAWGDNVE